LQVERQNELLWSQLSAADLAAAGADLTRGAASPSGLDDIVGDLIAGLPNARLLAIFCAVAPQATRVILYSLKNINALDCLKEYAPRGLAQCAEADLPLNLSQAADAILTVLRVRLDKLSA